MNTAIDLITISREYGSGGRDLAAALGDRLGWYVLDHDLIHRVAARLQLDERVVARLDEHPPALMARIASALLVPLPENPVILETTEMIQPDSIARAAQEEILDAAKSPPVIVVGHGTQCLFRRREGTLHLRVVAPLPGKLERLHERYGFTPEHAASEARRLDVERAHYVRRYYDRDVHDVSLYDLVINTGHISINEAAEMVTSLVMHRQTDRGTSREVHRESPHVVHEEADRPANSGEHPQAVHEHPEIRHE